MSWTNFKKALNRTGTQVLIKAGYIEQTIDSEFDSHLEKHKLLDKQIASLHKQAKLYHQSFIQVTDSHLQLVNSVAKMYDETQNLPSFVSSYLNCANNVAQMAQTQFHDPFKATIILPLARFAGYFQDINEAIKKREHKKIEYDKLRSKAQKSSKRFDGSTGPGSITSNKLQQSKQLYEALNTQLTQELPILYNKRLAYLQPSFDSFLKIQQAFFSECCERINYLYQDIGEIAQPDFCNGVLDHKIEDSLAKMRELNITSF